MSRSKKCVKLLIRKGLKVATAESCTCGLLAAAIGDTPGASACFEEGFITYSNEAKQKLIGVRLNTLKDFGAVSFETSREMALFAKNTAGADIGLSTTGIAGPDGGTPEKPVGLVYISCAVDNRVITRKYIFTGSRNRIRNRAAREAFRLLLECIKGYGRKVESNSRKKKKIRP